MTIPKFTCTEDALDYGKSIQGNPVKIVCLRTAWKKQCHKYEKLKRAYEKFPLGSSKGKDFDEDELVREVTKQQLLREAYEEAKKGGGE